LTVTIDFGDGMGMFHSSGSAALIRASVFRASKVRALMASAVFAGALALAGCDSDGLSYQLPTRAMKELSPQTLALLDEKHMPKDSPILIRLFKEESELEVWKKDTTGHFALLKVYPICRWSGDLGPKVREGDRQAPEGFYQITPQLMNPNSNYYLAINTGFPNAYDKANDRHGAFLMIHGDCSSRGCYAMTDEQIGEIYSLAREALLGGQQSFQIQAYPFRMTPTNLAHHRTNPNMAFWRMIKEGYDHFEVSHLEPNVEVCDRHYVFDAVPPGNSTKPLNFSPTGHCPAYQVAPDIAGPLQEKERTDQAQYAELVKNNLPVAPIHTGLDGGSNRVFLAQMGHLPPARVAPPDATGTTTVADVPPQPEPTSSTSHWLGALFGSKPSDSTQVASSEAGGGQEHSGGGGFFSNLFSSKSSSEPAAAPAPAPESAPPKPAHTQLAAIHPKPKLESAKTEGETAKAEPQQTAKGSPAPAQPGANNAASQSVAATGTLAGAQPVIPAGNFDSRWAAIPGSTGQ
jgi:murein L,D-transpeptidase YafK